MKKFLTLFAFLAFLLPLMQAQETLTVSDGTSTSGNVPFCGYYHDYGFKTEILYTADMLEEMVGGTISSLTFYANNTDTRNWTATTTVRMEEVSASQLSTTAWTSTEAAVVVYSGPFTLSNQQLVIELATPFVYQGGNLIMSFYAPHGGVCGPSGTNFLGAAATGKGVYKTGTSTSFDAAAPGSSVSMLPTCTFEYTAGGDPTCKKPRSLRLMEVAATTAYLKWDVPSTSNALDVTDYGFEYGPTGSALTAGTCDTLGAILENLEPGTAYTFRLWTNCGSSTSDTLSLSFTTRPIPATIPYTTGFEEDDDVAWEFLNGTAANKWVIGSAVNNGGTSAMYISDDNGTTNNYNISSYSVVYVTRDIQISEAGDYTLSFDWKGDGESCCDFARAAIVPMSTELVPGTTYSAVPSGFSKTGLPTGWIAADGGTGMNGATTWSTKESVFQLTEGNYKLVFVWKNDGSTGPNPPVAIDNVLMKKVTCPAPDSLVLDSTLLSTTSLGITWRSNGNESQWIYRLNDGEWNEINTNPYSIPDLEPGTPYKVELRAYCGEADTSLGVTATFFTECDVIATDDIPFRETFDEWPSMNPCWKLINPNNVGTSYYGLVSTSINPDGSTPAKALRMSPTSAGAHYIVMPEAQSLAGLSLELFAQISSSYASSTTLELGVMSDTADVESFTVVDTLRAGTSYTYFIKNLSDFASAGNFVAFRGTSTATSTGNKVFVDDIALITTPSCERPDSLKITDITTYTASLNIYNGDETNTYALTLMTKTDTLELEPVNENVVLLETLRPNTEYRVKVVTSCSDYTYPAQYISFRTECGAVDVTENPYVEGFETYSSVSNIFCWSLYKNTPTATNYNIATTALRVNNGGKSLQFTPSGNMGSYVAVMPEFEPTLSELELSIYVMAEDATSSGRFQIGYVTDANDTSSFVAMRTVSGAAYDDNYVLERVTFGGAPEGARIAFRHLPATTNYYWWIDDINVHLLPPCTTPNSVIVSNITETSASVDIADANDINSYIIALYDGTTLLDSVDGVDNHYDISTTLEPNTAYTLYVYTSCPENLDEPYVVTFRTLCSVIDELPYVMNFDSVTGGTSGSASTRMGDDLCWIFAHRAGTNYPYYSTSQPLNGANSLYFYGLGANNQTVAALPAFSASPSELQLSFSLRATSTGNSIEVGVMTDPNDPETFVALQNCIPATTTDWQRFDQTFAGYTEGYIALRTVGYGAYIDSLVVDNLPACTRPSSITLSDITTSSVNLTITDPNNIGNYVLVVVGEGRNDSLTLDNSDYSLTDLAAGSNYTLRAYTLCDGTLTEATEVFFSTLCEAHEGDLVTSFEEPGVLGTLPNCWQSLSVDGTVIVRNATNGNTLGIHSGSQYLDFRGSTSNLVTLPQLDREINTLELSFWTRPESFSNSNCGTFSVGYVTEPGVASSFVAVETYSYNSFTAIEQKNVTFTDAPEGSLIAMRHNAGNTSWYWFVDDIDIHQAPACLAPASLTVRDIESAAATLVINDTVENIVGNYTVKLIAGTDTVTIPTTDTVVPLTDMSPSTEYTVMVYATCDDGTTTHSVYTTFRTACGAIATLPWTENFNSYSTTSSATELPCWAHLGGGYVNITSSYSVSGNALRFYPNSSSVGNILVLPEFAADLNTLELTFSTRPESATSSGSFSVGYITDDTLASSFVEVLNIPASMGTTHTVYDVTFADAPEGARIAMRHNVNSTSYYWFIDNLDVHEAPSCHAPTIALGEVTTTSAVITLSDVNNVNHYQLYIDNDATGIEVTGTTYTIQNLTPASSHSVYAKTLCESGDTTRASVTLSFNTECDVIATLPWSENFDNATSDQMPACWDVFFNGSSASSAPHAGTSSYQTDLSGKWLYFAASTGSSSYGNPQMAILPPFQAAINTLTMTFRYEYESASYGTLEVGYVTGTDFNTDFVAVKTCTVNTDGTDDTVSFATAPAEAERIAFRWTCNNSTYYTAGVDNIVVDLNGDVPPVGIDEVEAADIVLFPNPATSNVTLRGVEAGSQVSVVDMNGRMVRDFKAANDNVRIDVSNLAKGAYFVRVVNGNTNAIRKLIVK